MKERKVMSFLPSNLRFLRKSKGLTQDQFAKKIGIKRSMIGSYEEGRAEPKLSTLQHIAGFFSKSVDELLEYDLEKGDVPIAGIDVQGKNIRILSIPVDPENNEQITLVPVKAAAGYLTGFADPEFIEDLPKFSLPMNELSPNRTYRAFQIKGDSMKPVQPGSYIFSEYLQNWLEIKDGDCYILITKNDGIVYKRVYNYIAEAQSLTLKSDNSQYSPYSIHISEVLEIWKAVGFLSFDLPEPQPDKPDYEMLKNAIDDLRQSVEDLKKLSTGKDS